MSVDILGYLEGRGGRYRQAGGGAQGQGPEWHGPCPWCGGGDRFHIWPEQRDGTYWCRQCGRGGDYLQLLRDLDGLSWEEAHLRARGRRPDRQGSARPGQGSRQAGQGQGRAADPARTAARKRAEARAYQPRPVQPPNATWQERGRALLASLPAALPAAAQAWLAGRGIDASAAAVAGLRWLDQDHYRPLAAWGLEPDGDRRLRVPAGLVIPWEAGGQLWRLRVRTRSGEPKYLVVRGGANAPATLDWPWQPGEAARPRAVCLVEAELDALMLWSLAGDLVIPVALTTCSLRPDPALDRLCREALAVLVALDADDNLAGGAAAQWWLARYDRARRCLPPQGKDCGEFHQAGGDVRAWLLAHLPPGLHPPGEGVWSRLQAGGSAHALPGWRGGAGGARGEAAPGSLAAEAAAPRQENAGQVEAARAHETMAGVSEQGAGADSDGAWPGGGQSGGQGDGAGDATALGLVLALDTGRRIPLPADASGLAWRPRPVAEACAGRGAGRVAALRDWAARAAAATPGAGLLYRLPVTERLEDGREVRHARFGVSCLAREGVDAAILLIAARPDLRRALGEEVA